MQQEQKLEIQNRRNNIKMLQKQRKELKKEKLENEKLYNSLKKDKIALTKINKTVANSNFATNFISSKNNDEPLIKKKQAQQVRQYELPDIYKNFIKDKINSQNLSENTSGILFDSNSQIAKRLINNNDFRQIIMNQITPEIFCLFKFYKNDIYIQYKDGVEFTYGNFKYAIRRADIINLKIDIFGNVSGDLVDTTDYNNPIDDLKIVKVGYELQKENKIVPKFVIIHFSIPIEKL